VRAVDSDSKEPWLLRCTLRNPTAQPVIVQLLSTPLSRFPSNMFEVLDVTDPQHEVRLPYEGAMFKRGPPLPQDFTAIDAGASIDGTVDLSNMYVFESGKQYRVAFAGGVESTVAPSSSVRNIDHAQLQLSREHVQSPAVSFQTSAASVAPMHKGR